MGKLPIGKRLAASPHNIQKRRNENSNISAKRFKQTNFVHTRTTSNTQITPPPTLSKPLKSNSIFFTNPLIAITDAYDLPFCTLPDNLTVSKKVVGDGNCLLRAILLALTGCQDLHFNLRKRAIECILENSSCFQPDIQLLGYSSVEAYCSKMSKSGEFGDVILLMACSITENVTIQLFTFNCHESDSNIVKTISSQTISPVNTKKSSNIIQVHLDTGDTTRNGIRTREPHYDILTKATPTPLLDITNLTINEILPTPTRISRSSLNCFSSYASTSQNKDAFNNVLLN